MLTENQVCWLFMCHVIAASSSWVIIIIIIVVIFDSSQWPQLMDSTSRPWILCVMRNVMWPGCASCCQSAGQVGWRTVDSLGIIGIHAWSSLAIVRDGLCHALPYVSWNGYCFGFWKQDDNLECIKRCPVIWIMRTTWTNSEPNSWDEMPNFNCLSGIPWWSLVNTEKRLSNGNMICRDSTGSHEIPVWTVNQRPPAADVWSWHSYWQPERRLWQSKASGSTQQPQLGDTATQTQQDSGVNSSLRLYGPAQSTQSGGTLIRNANRDIYCSCLKWPACCFNLFLFIYVCIYFSDTVAQGTLLLFLSPQIAPSSIKLCSRSLENQPYLFWTPCKEMILAERQSKTKLMTLLMG